MERDAIDVGTIKKDFAVGDRIETAEEIGNGRFATAGRANKGDGCSTWNIKGDVGKHRNPGSVGKVDVAERDRGSVGN